MFNLQSLLIVIILLQFIFISLAAILAFKIGRLLGFTSGWYWICAAKIGLFIGRLFELYFALTLTASLDLLSMFQNFIIMVAFGCLMWGYYIIYEKTMDLVNRHPKVFKSKKKM